MLHESYLLTMTLTCIKIDIRMHYVGKGEILLSSISYNFLYVIF